MATKATVFKAHLQIADMTRHYYRDHALTLAQHPSENDARLMVRLLAFALNASDRLAFSRGLSAEGEPELCEQDLNGDIDLWIEFGQVDEKWLRKACGRAKKVQLFCYGGRSVPIWWQQNEKTLSRHRNLQIWEIPEESVTEMAAMTQRSMQLQYNIGEGQIQLSSDIDSIVIEPILLQDYG